jgi:sugar phosphate permease
VLVGSIIVSLAATAIVLSLPTSAWLGIYAGLLVAAFGVWGTAPIFMGIMTSESVPFEGSGKAYGAVTGTGEFFGATVSPTVLGMVGDKYGLEASMWIGCAALVGVIFFSSFLRETAPRVLAKRKRAAASA